MDFIMENLPAIMAIIVAIGVAMYVILDGFDLGVGILFPFAPKEKDRTVMMNSIAPVWDGNETWLVLGGGGILACFPPAFAIIIPALYIPIMVMLAALIFRGVAFEFRARGGEKHQIHWNRSFAFGSIIATFSQGVVLGAFIQGFEVSGDSYATYAYAGGPFDWFSPFTLMCGMALVFGYALLGSCWLVSKCEGSLQSWARGAGELSLIMVGVFIAIVSLWTPMQFEEISERWFDNNNFAWLLPIPLVTAGLVYLLWRDLKRSDTHHSPFLYAVGIFLLSYLGVGISYWPYIVPRQITVWEAAANPDSLIFILIGALIILPVILIYTAYIYRVFWGKTGVEGYH